jgi:YbbR domain-containing protein
MAAAIWPFRHVGLKALSIGLATLLWMAVAGEETVERGLRVPLELQQFPAGLELLGEPPTVVDVRIRGSSGTVSRISPGDIVAQLDLRAARPGRRLFQLTAEQVQAPFGVEVIQVTPPAVAMLFENGQTREVPITASVEGEPAPGYVRGKWSVEPASVLITGPESAVKQANEAITETVSVAGATGTVVETVTLGLLDPSLRLVNPRPATVRVDVVPGPRERAMDGLPVHLQNLREDLSAQAIPAAVDVLLRGTREGLSRLNVEDVTAYVDLSGLGVGDYSVPVRVDTSDRVGAGVAGVTPANVQVRVTSLK